MDLQNAKLGEVYEVYLDRSLRVVNYDMRHIGLANSIFGELTMKATVIGYDNLVLLGWGVGDSVAPTDAFSIVHATVAPQFVISNLKDFRLALWVPRTLTVKQCLTKVGSSLTSGHTCKECNDYFQYAEHDTSTGVFKCGLCKGRAKLFG